MHSENSMPNPSTIPTPRAGFDRVLFSAPVVYCAPRSLPKLSLPKSLGPFRRGGDTALHAKSSPTYGRRAAYATADEGTFMEILYRPRFTPSPLFQVQFRAPMRHLLDLDIVDQAIKDLSISIFLLVDRDAAARVILPRLLPFRLTLSEVEFTLDFPDRGGTARALERSLLIPWSRRHFAPHLDEASDGRRPRHRRNSFRVYDKTEDDKIEGRIKRIRVARVEWVIRRDQLRAWRVNTIADLRGVPWTDRVPKRMRFVEFHPSRGNRHVPEWVYEGLVKVAGPAFAVQKQSPKARRRLRGRLRPNDFHVQAEAALRALEAEMAAI